jgi:hypothetical protein
MSRSDSHPVPSPDDDVLLGQLRHIIDTVDPVPSDVITVGKAAIELYRLDAQLMQFVSLSPAEAALRSGATSRMHFFELGEVSIDVEVRTGGAFSSVVGVVLDPEGAGDLEVTVETTSASFTTTTDDAGRFEVGKVPTGLQRVVVARAAGSVVTPWFRD